MRTFIVIVIGLVLGFGSVFATSQMGKGQTPGAIAFAALWLIFCGYDTANGVKAGYGLRDELLLHLLIYVLPVLGAWLATNYLS